MGQRRTILAMLALLASTVVLGPADAAGRGNLIFESGDPISCLEAVPASVAIGFGPNINLDVRVLLDGTSQSRGENVFATVGALTYGALHITVRASYESVTFSGTDAQGLIDQAKSRFVGGQRPSGIDVVFVLTDENIEADGNSSVVGLADCIGGVRFGDRAFAVGEDFGPDENNDLFLQNATAKVAGHEIGHLLGAHHHYANCVEGLVSEIGEPSPCTIMFNAVDLASLNFSALEASVVRGHASTYAQP
jgi:predicted Zn-dependent protease